LLIINVFHPPSSDKVHKKSIQQTIIEYRHRTNN